MTDLIQNNLREVWEAVPLSYLEKGYSWYKEARSMALDMSNDYNIDFPVVCGIVSCLSPQKHWFENIKLTEIFLMSKGEDCKHTGTQKSKACRIYSLNGIRSRDTQIATIEFELGGLKTINFFRNVYNPKDENYVTLDSHMGQIMMGKKTFTPKQYNVCKEKFIDFAKSIKIHPVSLQSAMWNYWRENKKQ